MSIIQQSIIHCGGKLTVVPLLGKRFPVMTRCLYFWLTFKENVKSIHITNPIILLSKILMRNTQGVWSGKSDSAWLMKGSTQGFT